MNKASIVARREFTDNMRTKTFWIGIAFFPIVMLIATIVPHWLDKQEPPQRYAVIDQSGWLDKAVLKGADSFDSALLVSSLMTDFRAKDPDLSANYPQVLVDWLSATIAASTAENRAKTWDDAQTGLISLFEIPIEQLNQGLKVISGDQRKLIEETLEVRRLTTSWWRELPDDERGKFQNSGRPSTARFERVTIPKDTADPEAWLKSELKDGRLSGYFVIAKDPMKQNSESLFYANNLANNSLLSWYSNYANDIVRTKRFTAAKIDPKKVNRILAPLSFKNMQIDESGVSQTVDSEAVLLAYLPMAFVYFLWFAILMVAQMLLTNTVEEKSNRTIEVLLSSISPLELMTGKILGIAATGISMVLTWIVFFVSIVVFVLPFFGVDYSDKINILVNNPVFLCSFVGYFILGYLLYAALLVGMGAVCNSLKEAQNFMMPITLILMFPLLAMYPIVKDPNGPLARILSYIPLFTPFAMMNRAAGSPPLIDYILTTIILLVTIALFFWAAAKVFRVGILLTGKPPQLREIWRWIKASSPELPND